MAEISKSQTFSTIGHHHPDVLAFNSIFYLPFILGSSIRSSPSSGSSSGLDVGDTRRGTVSKNKGVQREISIQ